MSNEDTLFPTAKVPHGLEPHGPVIVISGAIYKGYGSTDVSCSSGGRIVEGTTGICVVSSSDLDSNRTAVTDILPASVGLCSTGSLVSPKSTIARFCVYSYKTSLDTPTPYIYKVQSQTNSAQCGPDASIADLAYGTPVS